MRSVLRRVLLRVAPACIFVLIATSIAAPTVGARSDAFVFNQVGSSIVQGTDPVCTPAIGGGQVCSSMFMFLFEGRWRAQNAPNPDYPDGVHIGDRVCVEFDTETFDSSGASVDFVVEFGCPQDTGNLSFDGLQSATLLPTIIELENFSTGAMRTVTIAGTWTGIGAETRTKAKSKTREPGCITVSSENTRSREATFAGTLNGAPMTVDYASLTNGRTAFKTTCL